MIRLLDGKINARLNSGDDFTYDNEAELAPKVGGINSIIRQPVISNNYVDRCCYCCKWSCTL